MVHEEEGQEVYFDKVVLTTSENPHRIDLVRVAGSPELPSVMRDLVYAIGDIARVVSRVFRGHLNERRQLFEELHMTADLGLRGPNHDVDAALDNLEELKNHVADEFPSVRDDLWKRYGLFVLISLVFMIPGVVLFIAALGGHLGIRLPNEKGAFDTFVAAAIATFLIPFGVAIGLFLEFSYSVDREISYSQLLSMNPGRWRPTQRFINTLVSAYCFSVILGIGAVQVGVLSILLNDFISTRPILSIVVGFVAGFSFPYVRDLIHKFRPEQKK